MLPLVQKWLPEVPCVSSYHTNLSTYATLFGMPWLEQIMWRLTRALHCRCELTFCPSETTRSMLRAKDFKNVKIWSRGVDTALFTPAARDENLRASWGCSPADAEQCQHHEAGVKHAAITTLACKLGLTAHSNSPNQDESFIQTPPTGPMIPTFPELSPPPAYESLSGIPDLPASGFALPPPAAPQPFIHRYESVDASAGEGKIVLLYVGRISWEKNIRLLIEAFKMLPSSVRAHAKLVVVGDGPARADLTKLSKKLSLDVAFMGHQKGSRLAAMYASSDVSAFPSHTETFGQVILEALACGLPVVGLHAQGTSDLVRHGKTGLLLDVAQAATTSSSRMTRSSTASKSSTSPSQGRRPTPSRCSTILKKSSGMAVPIPTAAEFAAAMTPGTSAFASCARSYSIHLERLILDRPLRMAMGRQAQFEASQWTWWDAMNAVVVGYEDVIGKRCSRNLSNEELEMLRDRQVKHAPLTGPWIKLSICVYMVFFVTFVRYMLL